MTYEYSSRERELLAHAADALGMDTSNDEGDYEAQALAEQVNEAIGYAETWIDTDSRTRIGDLLLVALEADTFANPDDLYLHVAGALEITTEDALVLVDALMMGNANTPQ